LRLHSYTLRPLTWKAPDSTSAEAAYSNGKLLAASPGADPAELRRVAAILETKRRTRAYAKRQMTWLRSERNVHWVDGAEREQTFAAALRLLREVRS